MARSIDAEIQALAEKRQALWAEGGHGDEADAIGKKIAALYEEKRTRGASHGTPKQRERAIKRAVAERELDRLMTGQPVTPRP